MSVLGTGVAAGVAQAGLQSQQTARRADAQRAEDARRARDEADAYEQKVLDPSTSDADEQLPDSQTPAYENLYGRSGGSEGEPEPEPPAAPPLPEAAAGELYQHLDIQAGLDPSLTRSKPDSIPA